MRPFHWRRGLRIGLVGLAGLAVAWAAAAVARAEDAPPAKPAPAEAPAAPKKPAAPSAADAKCLACHGDAAKAGGHLVDFDKSARSAHAGKECADCHSDYDAFPHAASKSTIACAECHEEAAKVVAKAVHGKPPPPGSGSRAARCVDCHGVHDVFKAKERESRLYPLNVPATCGVCHGGVPERDPDDPLARVKPTRFADDTHGKGLLEAGLVVAPTCVTCHGGHLTVPASDPASPVHRSHAADTCGACHVGIVERYRKSVHGTTPRGSPEKNYNAKEPPTCTDCHRPHHIRRPGEDMRQATIETCGKCHEDRVGTYRSTYHGRVSDLGFMGAASCADCHTAHDILPASDPRSSVGPVRRVATCARCHAGATESFSSYAVHANAEDRQAWPALYWSELAMRGMILGVWALMGVHTLLWLARGLRERRAIHAACASVSGRWYERWRPTYRGLHLTLVLSFLLLALTGLPLHYHDRPWAPHVMQLFGGPGVARVLHRIGAIATMCYFATYLVHLGRRILRKEKGILFGPDSMVPQWKDLKDLRAHLRWFFRGGERPKFERWTYWEKFDFWAVFWGVAVIGSTGLIMWFPIAATRVLPGWAINLAHGIHSHEALLATSFIFTFHFFHSNLRPGKFPIDTMFLTGRLSEEELRFEHGAEWERMKADGRLDRDALPPPDPRVVRRARVLGAILMPIGLALLVAMLAALFA